MADHDLVTRRSAQQLRRSAKEQFGAAGDSLQLSRLGHDGGDDPPITRNMPRSKLDANRDVTKTVVRAPEFEFPFKRTPDQLAGPAGPSPGHLREQRSRVRVDVTRIYLSANRQVMIGDANPILIDGFSGIHWRSLIKQQSAATRRAGDKKFVQCASPLMNHQTKLRGAGCMSLLSRETSLDWAAQIPLQRASKVSCNPSLTPPARLSSGRGARRCCRRGWGLKPSCARPLPARGC